MAEELLIDQVTDVTHGVYHPYGWHHWPEHPWLSYQFRRGLGETQEGGGAVSEVLMAGSRMIPGDQESWHTRMDADRRPQCSAASPREGRPYPHRDELLAARGRLLPPGRIPSRARTIRAGSDLHEDGSVLARNSSSISIRRARCWKFPTRTGKTLCAYFVRAPFPGERLPVLICMGGLDSIKDEMWFMQAHGALQRGISVLMIDGPGQGGTLRRHKIRQPARL